MGFYSSSPELLLALPDRSAFFKKRRDALSEIVAAVTPADPIMAEFSIDSAMLLNPMDHLFRGLDCEGRICRNHLSVFCHDGLKVVRAHYSGDKPRGCGLVSLKKSSRLQHIFQSCRSNDVEKSRDI